MLLFRGDAGPKTKTQNPKPQALSPELEALHPNPTMFIWRRDIIVVSDQGSFSFINKKGLYHFRISLGFRVQSSGF